MVYIVFLRGINVGGKAKVSMSVLKDALLKDKFSSVKTRLNSGNVIVKCNFDYAEVNSKMSDIIKHNFNLDINLMIYTIDSLKAIIEADPFDAKYDDLSKKCIGFTGGNQYEKTLDKLTTENNKWFDGFDELICSHHNQLYLYYVNGQGRSKLTAAVMEKKIGHPITVRNWNTIQKVYNLAQEVSNEA